jgi:hypothetical protein
MKSTLILLLSFCLAAIALCQTRSEFLATLTGAGKSKVVYKTRGNEAELQFEGERFVHNASYTLSIGDRSWNLTSDGLGKMRLSLRFGTASRPAISAGTIAALKNSSGVEVSRGTFVKR